MTTQNSIIVSSIVGVCNNAGRDINYHNYAATKRKTELVEEFHVTKTIDSFKGRDTEMKQLNNWFFTNKEKMAVICGCAGFGKTELARQFVRQCKDTGLIMHILWMEAETRQKLLKSFQDLALLLEIPPNTDDTTLVQLVYQKYNTRSSMVVFDNAVNRTQIAEFEPTGGECLWLATSHLKDWGDTIPSLELTPLSLDASVAVLRAVLGARFQEEDVSMYEALVDAVGHVPLALQVSAAYLRQEQFAMGQRFDLREFINNFNHSRSEFINKSIADCSEFVTENSYTNSISHAMKLSLCKIRDSKLYHKISDLALKTIHICAYLNPDKILISDILKLSCIQKLLASSHDLVRALSLLDKYSFIRFSDPQITIHRLIQYTLIQGQLIEINQNEIFSACLELLLFKNRCHNDFILKFANEYVDTIKQFNSQHKNMIISNKRFFYSLIENGSEIFLKLIFDELKKQAVVVINTHCLLHWAVWCQQYDVMKLLLARGANVEQRRTSGFTPLLTAANKLDIYSIHLLTSINADVNATGIDGNSVLHQVLLVSGKPQHVARSVELCDLVQWLVEQGARTDVLGWRDRSLLHMAAFAHNVEIVRLLVEKYHLDVNSVDVDGRTPLFSVCKMVGADKGRRLVTAECLVALGARRDVRNKAGKTPAEHAREQGLEDLAVYLEDPTKYDVASQISAAGEVLRSLVAAGDTSSLARILDEMGEYSSKNIIKYSLLHVAAERRQHGVLELLLDRGIDVNSRSDGNATALRLAAEKFDLGTIQLLVKRGADVNAVDANGSSILHRVIVASGASIHSRQLGVVCELLRWLVDRGARPDTVTRAGSTLLHGAAWALWPDLISYVVSELQQSVHAVDVYGRTPLYFVSIGLRAWQADEARGISTAARLLELGAQRDILDLFHNTPAKIARDVGHEQLATYLDNPEAQRDSRQTAAGLDLNVDAHVQPLKLQLDAHVETLKLDTQAKNLKVDAHVETLKMGHEHHERHSAACPTTTTTTTTKATTKAG